MPTTHARAHAQHVPAWRDRILAMATKDRQQHADLRSHLFHTDEGVLGTFLRIDLPILPEMAQFTYVLYTGARPR